MPLLKYPWNTLSTPGVLALFAIPFWWDTLGEPNRETLVPRRGGGRPPCLEGPPPKTWKGRVFQCPCLTGGDAEMDFCAWRQQRAGHPTGATVAGGGGYFRPPMSSEEVPSPGECHLTVWGLWGPFRARKWSSADWLSQVFGVTWNEHWQIFIPLPALLKWKGLSRIFRHQMFGSINDVFTVFFSPSGQVIASCYFYLCCFHL